MNKLVFPLLTLLLYAGCENHSSIYKLSDNEIKRIYTIEKDISNEYRTVVVVYVLDTNKLKQVHDYLVEKYKDKFSEIISIWYFDKKGVGENYLATRNDRFSYERFDEMMKHLIASYEAPKSKKGKLVRHHQFNKG